MEDAIAVIEAAYRHELSEHDWLGLVGEAVSGLVGTDLVTTAAVFDVNDGLKLRHRPALGRPELSEAYAAVTRQVGPEEIGNCMLRGPCTSLREALWNKPAFAEVERKFGVADAVGLVAGDPTGRGVLLAVMLPKVWNPERGLKARLGRLAAHIAAGYRVRRMLGNVDAALPDIFSSAEAVLAPSGRVLHAETEAKPNAARERLRRAAIAMDRARSNLRREDPDQAIESWRGLVSGRWSLVDHFDTDGRRVLIARRNDPRTEQPAHLTERERQVVIYRALGHPLKLIAYELGLSISTVAANLSRGMKKLGITSQTDLVGLLAAAFGATAGGSPN